MLEGTAHAHGLRLPRQTGRMLEGTAKKSVALAKKSVEFPRSGWGAVFINLHVAAPGPDHGTETISFPIQVVVG